MSYPFVRSGSEPWRSGLLDLPTMLHVLHRGRQLLAGHHGVDIALQPFVAWCEAEPLSMVQEDWQWWSNAARVWMDDTDDPGCAVDTDRTFLDRFILDRSILDRSILDDQFLVPVHATLPAVGVDVVLGALWFAKSVAFYVYECSALPKVLMSALSVPVFVVEDVATGVAAGVFTGPGPIASSLSTVIDVVAHAVVEGAALNLCAHAAAQRFVDMATAPEGPFAHRAGGLCPCGCSSLSQKVAVVASTNEVLVAFLSGLHCTPAADVLDDDSSDACIVKMMDYTSQCARGVVTSLASLQWCFRLRGVGVSVGVDGHRPTVLAAPTCYVHDTRVLFDAACRAHKDACAEGCWHDGCAVDVRGGDGDGCGGTVYYMRPVWELEAFFRGGGISHPSHLLLSL